MGISIHRAVSVRLLGTLGMTIGALALIASTVQAQGATQMATDVRIINPIIADESVAPVLSAARMEEIFERKEQLRERMAAQEDNNPPGPAGLAPVQGVATRVGAAATPASRFHGNPAQLVIGRSFLNTNARMPTASTLVEPAAANNARLVFAAGNFNHAEISTNGGATWTNVPLPAGPAEAPILCCDHDVVIDDARRVLFHSYLYINNQTNNGVVRIDVRRTIAGPGGPACSYLINPAGVTTLPDFPHLGLSKDFLYLSVNEINTGTNTQRAQMYRLPTDQMADCVGVAALVFNWPSTIDGQRVWRPVEGANMKEAMWWMHHISATQVRIFQWFETVNFIQSFVRTVSSSNFGNGDCRGGTNNNDWWDSLAASIVGFTTHGAVGHDRIMWQWPTVPDRNHTQGHIHGAVFSLGLALIAQPVIFNNNFCFGLPTLSANKESDFGLTLAFGGRAGGGGTAALAGVSIDDDFTPGHSFPVVVFTTNGTINRPDARHGDYFTIHPHEPCEKWFVATNYSLLGLTPGATNSRYIEFGRNRSFRCYQSHSDAFPETLTPE